LTARLALAFFASGAAALLFQVLWFRALGRLLGNTVWTGALVLTAFMLGMALGGMLAARWSRRIRRPALVFAIAEGVVGLTGCALVWGLPVLEPMVGQWLAPTGDTAAATLRLVLALAAMLVPTTAMGMTLALGVRTLAGGRSARVVGILYAANTAGACLAPLAAEFFLIGELGLRGTALAAGALNAAAAALALSLRLAASPAPAAAAPARLPRNFLLAAALAGGIALALEVVWFRLLILYAPGSDDNFAIMLAVVLVGIALGGVLAAAFGRLDPVWTGMGGCVAVIAGYILAGWAFGADAIDPALRALLLMLPAAVVSGLLFTLLGERLRAGAGDPQPAIGLLTTANTLGAALGAALAALVLLPRLGIEGSLFALAAGYALLTLLLARGTRLVLPLAAAACSLLLFPFGRMNLHLSAAALPYQVVDGARVARVVQGPTTTLQLLRADRFGEPLTWRLVTDGYSMTAVNNYANRYMQMFAWLPFALHPEPRSALLISYGAGNTAQALLSGPGMRRLVIVDVSTEILGVSPLMHGEHDPLRDPRVDLRLQDGRHYLRLSEERFDVITAEPPPPLIAGVVNLYTREYFEAFGERLAPGGLASYWLPAYQFQPEGARAVVRAFCDVFPDCTLWAGNWRDWILLGSRDFAQRPSAARFSRLWRDPGTAPLVAANGFESPAQLGAAFLADAAQLRAWTGATPALVDDYPKRMAPGEGPSQEESYAPLLDPGAASRRFRESAWVAKHWPPELAEAALAFFPFQPALNGRTELDPVANLPLLDAILRGSDLRIPVLWTLGSNVAEQEIVNRRLAADGFRPAFARALGVRALAERDYATAARMFEQTPEVKLAEYSKCRAKGPGPCL
jgi:spermidine synthase